MTKKLSAKGTKMGSLVVKDNALVNASFKLDLIEQRLIILAITEARETGTGIDSDSHLTIHASKYIETFGGERQAAYKALKSASETLFFRYFSFTSLHETGVKHHRSRWVSDIAYQDGTASVDIRFSPIIAPLITRLEKHFTSYDIEQISHLTSKYAIRLYELLIAWKNTRQVVSFDLQDFRDKIGLDTDEYKTMSNFKKFVLDVAVSQINEHTDMTVSYQQKKKGVRVSGFDFRMKMKPTQPKIKARDPDTDIFVKLTDAQRSMFGSKLAHDNRIESEYAHLIGAGSYEDFGKVLADKLLEEKFFKKVYPILLENGFQPPKKTAL